MIGVAAEIAAAEGPRRVASAAMPAESLQQTLGNGAGEVLFDTLLDEQAALAGRVREAIQAQLPAYCPMPQDPLDGEVEIEIEWVLRRARGGRTVVDDHELADLSAVGEARALQGIPVADMLRAWRIGVEVVVDYAREVGHRLGIGDAEVLEFVQSTLTWSDVAMVTTAGAHRSTELALALADDEHRTTFVRGVLFGAVPAAELRIQAEAYGLDPTREYVAVRAEITDGTSHHELERLLGLHKAETPMGLTAVIDACVAGFLSEPPPPNVRAVVGVGLPKRLEHLTESYRSAARALATIRACRLKGAYDIPSLGLRAAVAMDTDVGEALRQRYLEPLNESGSGRELITTLRAYLACGMHVERTATKLFVHQNTVRYRLTRFEQLTGASLRETQVLFEVWWAVELAAMRL
jgi:hypothetical protein